MYRSLHFTGNFIILNRISYFFIYIYITFPSSPPSPNKAEVRVAPEGRYFLEDGNESGDSTFLGVTRRPLMAMMSRPLRLQKYKMLAWRIGGWAWPHHSGCCL
ncbi:hypothetical protein GDO78_016157 [Eleutherodactylus coqui]|uniref:Uncharacterized protein n=1 Tax=Eleutherodactylus coqui TaxID=57060 RepID=A0A8J6EKN9_ELECQ|nr:hypothetical protein GDO78_016157 [Eleutherodactylus coqui]